MRARRSGRRAPVARQRTTAPPAATGSPATKPAPRPARGSRRVGRARCSPPPRWSPRVPRPRPRSPPRPLTLLSLTSSPTAPRSAASPPSIRPVGSRQRASRRALRSHRRFLVVHDRRRAIGFRRRAVGPRRGPAARAVLASADETVVPLPPPALPAPVLTGVARNRQRGDPFGAREPRWEPRDRSTRAGGTAAPP